jgi:hypothetical protein
MEKAILKTLIYYDIFNFPLKAWEIHKWLIGKKASLQQIEKTLRRMGQGTSIKYQGDYYFLTGRKSLVKERQKKEQVSKEHLQTIKYISQIFKIIPWIKLVGISGSLSMMGSSKKDDIDLFIITADNRIWMSRLLLIFLTSLTGLRRKRREKVLSANGKICINLILEESNLAQQKKNIYVAHEVLQMRVLWQGDEVYSRFLHANDWAFKHLPNWKSGVIESRKSKISKLAKSYKSQKYNSKVKDLRFVDWLEEMAKRFQLRIMGSPDRSERIENGALYFHPEDKGVKVLEEYKKRVRMI